VDIGGKVNIVGDGIHIAQRVMDSGDAGHIRSFEHNGRKL